MRTSGIQYESLELQEPHDRSVPVRVFNTALGTKKTCISALIFSALLGVGFLIVGGLAKGSKTTFHFSAAAVEALPFGINFLVLIATEANGYIHAVSLRWALFAEDKLEFNSNLRLLTFSKKQFANGILANIIYFISLATCYGASPMVVIRNTDGYYHYEQPRPLWNQIKDTVSLSRIAPLALGIAILLQCALSTWCLQTSYIPTWSSHPLTTLAASQRTGQFPYTKGRCMMSAHDRYLPPTPTAPAPIQKAPYFVSKRIRVVLMLITIVLFAFAVWAGLIIHYGHVNNSDAVWNFFPTAAADGGSDDENDNKDMTQTVFLKFFSHGGTKIVPEVYMIGVLAFNTGIQSFLTIGMHCAELQVTLLRDEHIWCTLADAEGCKPESTYNSIMQPLKSIPNVILLLSKVIVHWMFGSALSVDYARGVAMRVPHVTYLTGLWALFLVFAVNISFIRRKGPLPASYGHLKTMRDVAGDVEGDGTVMLWGDQGEAETDPFASTSSFDVNNAQHGFGSASATGIRHAGASMSPLPPVQMRALYS